jgi:signal transduction histidine kinase
MQNEDITQALYEISNAVNTTSDLNQLYEKIHLSLGRIIDTRNFYIAIYNAREDYIQFPYFVDERSQLKPGNGYHARDRKSSLTLRVIRTGKPLLMTKAESLKYSSDLNSIPSGPGAEIWIGIPLIIRKEVIGVLAVQSYSDPHCYSANDVNLLNSVSDQIALAIDRKRSEEELKDREKLISVLYKLSNAMHTTATLDQLYHSIHETLNRIIDAKNFTIAMYDWQTDTLEFHYSTDKMDKTMLNPVENASRTSSLSYQVIKRGKTLLLNEDEKAELYRRIKGKMIGDISAKTWLGVPLRGKNEILGVVIIQNYEVKDCYEKKEVKLLESVSDQIAFAIEYKRAETELDQVQKELIKKAHKAGMTDIASDTLHNIGNILNSVKTSNNIVHTIVSNSVVEGLNKAIGMLKSNLGNLKEFLYENPNGEKLIQYLIAITNPLNDEIRQIREQTERLGGKIELMTNVIRAQQAYVNGGYMEERTQLANIVDSTLDLHWDTFHSYGIKVVKQYEAVPDIFIQRTKLSHVLMNLIVNAKDAMIRTEKEDRMLTIVIRQDDKHVFLIVKDTGEGIESKNLKRIFNHGFTTKYEGHGFGLHNSANFMTEMKGAIWAESEGLNKGASFILRFNKS